MRCLTPGFITHPSIGLCVIWASERRFFYRISLVYRHIIVVVIIMLFNRSWHAQLITTISDIKHVEWSTAVAAPAMG